MIKKLWCGILLYISCLPWAHALSAQSAIVIDADTKDVLFEQGADEQRPMASTTKIMTALVALGEGNLDRTYTVKKEYTLVEGSSMYLKEGEEITMRDTLYGLMLCSGNDAALAVAGECGGLQVFLDKMNAKAAALGLQHTHFDNPNGLTSDTHYTTARDLAYITAAAMQDPVFRKIVSTVSYTAGTHTMANHNRLLKEYDGAIGVKTGYTKAAGRCLVSAAERHGRTLIVVTLNDPDDWRDHAALFDQTFAQYEEVTLHEAGQEITSLEVFGGDTDRVPLVAQHTVTAYLRPEEREKITLLRYGEKICYAPVIQQAAAGHIEYRVADKLLVGDNLLYGGASVLLPEEKSLPEQLLEYFLQKETAFVRK